MAHAHTGTSDYELGVKVLSLSIKEYNYGIYADQTSSNLTKFIVNNMRAHMSLNKFIMKIYSTTNVMVLILYYEYYYFLYNFI
jgi:hypothetical protein